ncbi:ROK family protein [Paenibacillus wenxiniae]|uniref:ROK family protein n=1 Tax=Paenibacillus wenxiniae TaxID=1636843 RepID=A0ABW4RJI7_9BACL
MKTANANMMKQMNLHHVRQVMKQVETATKPQLAGLTKLSVVTINSLVRELHKRGEIFEDALVPSNGGRPALTYRYNYDFSLGLVIYMKDCGGKFMLSSVVINLENRVLSKREQIVSSFKQDTLDQLMDECIAAYPAIQAIGIGVPGQVVDGEIMTSSHRELEGVRMIEQIGQRFNLPVFLENDVNAAVYGYHTNHKLDPDHTVTGLYFPDRYPPGMGIHQEGRLIRGKSGMAGEIKFLPFDIDWYTESNSERLADAIGWIIQSVNSILAPEHMVIYQNSVAEGAWRQALERYQARYPSPVYPDIFQKHNFEDDFETGMRWLTLQALQPATSYE